MELNRLVFPCPSASYSHESMEGKLIYVPKPDAKHSVVGPYGSTPKSRLLIQKTVPKVQMKTIPVNQKEEDTSLCSTSSADEGDIGEMEERT